MKSNEILLAQIENYLAQLELPSEPERLYAPIGYSLAAGGKRIRPMLVMLACELFCDRSSVALPAAAAVEVFHNFTLLHDDIMDNAQVRRGKPAVHVKWDRNVAILSGDVMMIWAYKLLSQLPSASLSKILTEFNTMAAEVCEGQQYDMDYETRVKVSMAEYIRMIELKTSVLLGSSAAIGAILGGASDEQCRVVKRFATEIGIAFQLQDDLLDSYGDEQLGKAIGGDILEGKQTFLMNSAMSRADEAQRQVLRSTHLDAKLTDEQKIAQVKSIFDQLDIPRFTEKQIRSRFDKGLSLLSSLDVDDERLDNMRSFVEGLINRKK
ncbi:MAG: polyprenyl synthetase family protein [Rikenellaceae bacterium]